MAIADAERPTFERWASGDPSLLTTKWARPRIPSTYVGRPRMVQMLDEGTAGLLTVVSAGAGWGKTLAAAAWSSTSPSVGPVAWLSLDDTDNHAPLFWAYVAAAVRRVVEVPSGNPLARLSPGLGDERENLRRLVAGIASLPTPVVLVLDDFQVIHDPALLSSLADLLRHAPAQLRLVILTRADPALPLHRLRLAGDLTEIRSRDLAFGPAEAVSLLALNGVMVGAEDAELLVGRTEGWPAGLRLAAFFLGQGSGRTAADFAGDDQAVTDYILEEVFTSQPPELRRFLARTSVTQRLSSDLAQVLTDEPRAQRFLETLERSNAFVLGLGTDRRWYRYHPLLREVLHHQLTMDEPELVPELHRAAALWFASNGDPVEAMQHAADASDWGLLGRLFVTHAAPRLVSSDRAALHGVLARIPTGRLSDGPEMELCAAGRLLSAGRFQDMQSHLDRAEAELGLASTESRSGTYVAARLLSTAVARTNGDIGALVGAASAALDELSGAAATLPAAEDYRAVALGNLGTGLLWSGHFGEAEARLLEGFNVATLQQLDVSQINVLAHLGLVATCSGRSRQGYAYAARAVEQAEARGWALITQAATAYLALSMVHLQWNEVDEAQRLLKQGRRAAVKDLASRYALRLAEVRLDASLGRAEEARERLAQLTGEFGPWRPPAFLARWLVVTEAEVDLALGDPEAVLSRIGDGNDPQPPFAHEQVCRARALLSRGELHAAEAVLAHLRAGPFDRSAVVEAWLLSALVADRLREDNRAVDALGRALKVARPDRIRRPFLVRDTEQLSRLLARVHHLDPGASEFARELQTEMGPTPANGVPHGVAAEPLTDRESSVLRYLSTMMTNAEIASELFVSVNTVKVHLKHIYRKLGVVSRRQAVHRARELGLLTE